MSALEYSATVIEPPHLSEVIEGANCRRGSASFQSAPNAVH